MEGTIMSRATIWNTESTNYNRNAFVKRNGTEQLEIKSEAEAMRLISDSVNNPAVQRMVLELATGNLSWVRTDYVIPDYLNCDDCGCDCDDCDSDGECNGDCGCEDCPENFGDGDDD